MDRIVSVTTTDLLTLYGVIMKLANKTVTAVNAKEDSSNGQFEITSGSGNVFATEPVKNFTIGSSVTSVNVYFVPAYNYSGFVLGTTPVTTTGDEVVADGRTLYLAALSSGTITITKQGI